MENLNFYKHEQQDKMPVLPLPYNQPDFYFYDEELEIAYCMLKNKNHLELEISKIDTPLLIGVEVIGPISVFAGPSFQYILDNKLKGIDLQKVEDEFTVGLNIGVGLQLGRLGLDVRYERGLNSNEAEFTSNNTSFRLDTRPEQLIFNISYSFTKINK